MQWYVVSSIQTMCTRLALNADVAWQIQLLFSVDLKLIGQPLFPPNIYKIRPKYRDLALLMAAIIFFPTV